MFVSLYLYEIVHAFFEFSLSQVKKAYLKAVRFVHPDKLPGKLNLMIFIALKYADCFHLLCCLLVLFRTDDLSVEMQMVAEAVFIVLTDAFNKYRARIEASSA